MTSRNFPNESLFSESASDEELFPVLEEIGFDTGIVEKNLLPFENPRVSSGSVVFITMANEGSGGVVLSIDAKGGVIADYSNIYEFIEKPGVQPSRTLPLDMRDPGSQKRVSEILLPFLGAGKLHNIGIVEALKKLKP